MPRLNATTLSGELLQRGYIYSELILERRYKQYLSPNGKFLFTKGAHYNYPFISRDVYEMSKDKLRSYEFAQLHDVAIPATLHTSDLDRAKPFLARHKRVVVKPFDGSASKGLTVDVTTDIQLEQALHAATFDDKAPLVQEQFIGEEIRLTALDGVVRSVILRQTPRVVGDGSSSISELIAVENEDRQNLQFPFISYPQLDAVNIPEHLLRSKQIPAHGEIIELSKTTMIRHGASFYGVTDQVHPSYVQIAEHLVSQLNAPMLVVDLMVKDYTHQASDNNYIFLEFNTAPHLEIYSLLRSGDQPDIIRMLADMVDAYALK
ncbi:MAG: Cyanophycin synthase [Candidatus Saccharibacteria bacterium]|nr:Cyanophycin synthase [Candidatus Saccharibacteria bacterium]